MVIPDNATNLKRVCNVKVFHWLKIVFFEIEHTKSFIFLYCEISNDDRNMNKRILERGLSILASCPLLFRTDDRLTDDIRTGYPGFA